MPLVSVIICTRNRSASLARTLRSLVRAAAHVHDPWELLIVDNGSTDDTSATVASFSGQLPVRRVPEPKAGLSNARNAGVRESQGEFVLWTDDDVLVDEQWLNAWFRAFRDHPGEALFGGRSEPVYEPPEQAWFIANQHELRSLLAIRNTPEWATITRERVPFGLNYAIRGIEQRAHPYDPRLGVAPGRRRGGEEVAVIREILTEGGTGRWVWDATVYHLIPTERQTEAYIRQFYSAHGYDHPVVGQRVGPADRTRGVLRALLIWAKASISFRLKRRIDQTRSVPALVTASRAKASLRRYLGLKEP